MQLRNKLGPPHGSGRLEQCDSIVCLNGICQEKLRDGISETIVEIADEQVQTTLMNNKYRALLVAYE
jgi:hypothetical protein